VGRADGCSSRGRRPSALGLVDPDVSERCGEASGPRRPPTFHRFRWSTARSVVTKRFPRRPGLPEVGAAVVRNCGAKGFRSPQGPGSFNLMFEDPCRPRVEGMRGSVAYLRPGRTAPRGIFVNFKKRAGDISRKKKPAVRDSRRSGSRSETRFTAPGNFPSTEPASFEQMEMEFLRPRPDEAPQVVRVTGSPSDSTGTSSNGNPPNRKLRIRPHRFLKSCRTIRRGTSRTSSFMFPWGWGRASERPSPNRNRLRPWRKAFGVSRGEDLNLLRPGQTDTHYLPLT